MIRPAAIGTYRFTNSLDACYTAGRDCVGEALLSVLRRTSRISADIETFGLGTESRKIKSVTIGDERHAVVMDPRDPKQRELIKLAFTTATEIIFHNSVYDVPNLYRNGLLTLDDIRKIVDTIIYCRMANPSDIGGNDLFKAGNRYAGLTGENHLAKAFKAMGLSAENGWRVFDIDRPIYLQGAAADVIITARVFEAARQAAYYQTTSGHPFTADGVTGDEAVALIERDQIVNRVLLRQTCIGLAVDLDYLNTYQATTSAKRREAESELERYGIEPGNGDSLTGWLESNNALPATHPRTPKTGKASAKADDLELIDHPIAQLFVAQKRIVKIQKDYLQKAVDLSLNIDGVDRVFPITSILKAATGRAAMADPPLHQFSGPARGILVPDKGETWTSMDWSAIEPTIVANLAGEVPVYTHYETWYPDKRNRDTGELGTYGDMYEGIAELASVPRKTAKVILLAGLYGEGKKKLAGDLGISVSEAEDMQAQIFDPMPGIVNFINTSKYIAREYACAMTLSGRIIPVPMGTYDGKRSIQAHKGINYTVQGGAYDVLAETIVACDEAGLSEAIRFTMHDELIVSTEAAPDIRKIMETPPERLCRLAGRTPMLRTDSALLTERWMET